MRIFPTGETWVNYGSMLEFSSPNNQILHEHLFPDAARKHAMRNGVATGTGNGSTGSRKNKPTAKTANNNNSGKVGCRVLESLPKKCKNT